MCSHRAPFVFLLTFFVSSPAVAATDAGAWFSDKAVAVVRLKKPSITSAKVAQLITATLPDDSPALSEILRFQRIVEDLLATEVDGSRDLLIGVFAVDDIKAPLTPAIIIPTQNAQRLQDRLQVIPNLRFFVQDSTLICTLDASVMDQIKQRIASEGRSFFAVQRPEDKAVFDAGDLSVQFEIERMRRRFRQLLGVDAAGADRLLLRLLRSIAAARWERGLIDELLEVYSIFVGSFLRLKNPPFTEHTFPDAESLVVVISVEDAGILLDVQLAFQAGSHTALRFTDPPSTLPLLERLPSGRQLYVASTSFDSYASVLTPLPLGPQLVGIDGDPNALIQFNRTVKQLNALKSGEGAVGLSLPATDGSSVFRLTSIRNVSRPEVHRRLINQLAAVEAQLATFILGKRYAFDERAERFATRVGDVHQVRFKDPENASVDPRDIALYGARGFSIQSLYVGSRWLTTVGRGKAEMAYAVRRLEQTPPPEEDAAFQVTRGRLLKQANFVAMIDSASLLSTTILLFRPDFSVEEAPALELSKGLRKLSAPKERSYFGVSGRFADHKAKFRLFLPTKQLEALWEFFPIVKQLRSLN